MILTPTEQNKIQQDQLNNSAAVNDPNNKLGIIGRNG